MVEPDIKGASQRVRHPIRHFRAYLMAIVSLVAASVLLTAVTTSMSLRGQLQEENQREILRSQELNRLQNQLVQPILLSRWMSRDGFLFEWIRDGEKRPEQVLRYLKELSAAWQLSAFVASARTHRYYFSDGTSKALTPDAADVGWFFHLLEQRTESLADVGYHNGDPQQPFLYIDIRMPDLEGRTSAYVGTAVELKRFLGLLEDYRRAYGDELHFVNQDGMVILSTRQEIVNTPASSYDWHQVMDRLPHVHGQAPGNASSALTRDGRDLSLTRRWITELGWHLYIERDLRASKSGVYDIIFRTIGLIALQIALALLAMYALLRRFNRSLDSAFAQIRTLKGILPICCSCKKIRDDQGYWQQLEQYIQEHSEADLSHGICPDCARKLYPGLKLTGLAVPDKDQP